MTVKDPKIYPFECHFKSATYDFKAQVVQVGYNGILCNTGKQVLKPSEILTAKFTFPVLNKTVEAQVMSYKIYDKFKGTQKGTSGSGDHIIEFVFKNIDQKLKDILVQFTAIAQAYKL